MPHIIYMHIIIYVYDCTKYINIVIICKYMFPKTFVSRSLSAAGCDWWWIFYIYSLCVCDYVIFVCVCVLNFRPPVVIVEDTVDTAPPSRITSKSQPAIIRIWCLSLHCDDRIFFLSSERSIAHRTHQCPPGGIILRGTPCFLGGVVIYRKKECLRV